MSLSDSVSNALLRLRLALRQIDEIKRGEHTHDHPKNILKEVADTLEEHEKRVERAVLTANEDICRNAAADLIVDLDMYLPLLGFILRSSNVRNAFEVFDPLIAMCRALLGDTARLIYSSEWDYSPFTRTFTFPKLHNVVVVGLPAHESSNSLIIPVVGHELGHAKWKQSGVLATLQDSIERDVLSYFVQHLDEVVGKRLAEDIRKQAQPEASLSVFVPEVGHAQYLAKLQCEEVFCDIVGIRIFGSSYLRAFAYLIFPSPKALERQSFEYPSNGDRAVYMRDAAIQFRASFASDYGGEFDDILPKDLVGQRRHMVLAADAATKLAFPRLMDEVRRLIPETMIAQMDETRVSMLISAFGRGRPGDGVFHLSEIVEAAWRSYLQRVRDKDCDPFGHLDALNEFVFKTIEVAEFYRRIPSSDANEQATRRRGQND